MTDRRAEYQGAPVLLGNSAGMRAVRAEIEATARTHAKVLITGETGVGKEVVARSIHMLSSRRDRPFVPVNCSGIPETLLESELFGHTRGSFTGAHRDRAGIVRQAEQGTLFLDELGEMSLRMQAVLLRFTETGEIQPVGSERPTGRSDVRLITATNRDLRAQIAAGAFREDLYYRLNVLTIQIPPLRDRDDDILLLLKHYLAQAALSYHLPPPTLTADASQLLVGYEWPGNVRQLRNVAERLVLLDRRRPLAPDDLPAEVLPDSRVPWQEVEHADVRVAAGPPVQAEGVTSVSEGLWQRMRKGEDFWNVVQRPFKARELTRVDLLGIVDRGLRETGGSYREMVRLFNLPPSDYKRLHAFLYQQDCNLAVHEYRRGFRDRGRVSTTYHAVAEEAARGLTSHEHLAAGA